MWCSPSAGALPVPEILAPHPASACNSLHFGSGIEENQSLGPDLFSAAARECARTRARDARGQFAKGHSGNPRGRPPGIPNPQRRVPDLMTLCLRPGAALGLARRAGPSGRAARHRFPEVAPDRGCPKGDAQNLGRSVARRDRPRRGRAPRPAGRRPPPPRPLGPPGGPPGQPPSGRSAARGGGRGGAVGTPGGVC